METWIMCPVDFISSVYITKGKKSVEPFFNQFALMCRSVCP